MPAGDHQASSASLVQSRPRRVHLDIIVGDVQLDIVAIEFDLVDPAISGR
jgi:hypothetical protein